MATLWKKFKQDFRERFLNLETAKGIYLFPAGLVLIYASVYHVEYVIQAAGALAGGYFTYEGIRKITVNRVKQALARKKLFEDREHLDAGVPGN